MAFYSLSKEERTALAEKIAKEIKNDLAKKTSKQLASYFSNEDTYIRKSAYLAIGRIYDLDESLRPEIVASLKGLLNNDEF